MLVNLVALLALAKSVAANTFITPIECFSNGQIFECSGQGLEFVPSLPPQVVSALLNNNALKFLEPHLPPSLLELDLSNNLLNTLELTSPQLRSLQVSDNPLMTLNLDLISLRSLNASGCSIAFLPPGFFERLPKLEVLDLSGNDKLRAIPANNLLELHLQRTLIRSLPSMRQLVYLDVSNNVNLLHLQTSETLKTLKAANCSLSGVYLNPGLVSADISSNQISILKIDENLEYLDASNNSLVALDIANARLQTVNLAKNKLTDIRVSSRYLAQMDLSQNPIIELSVHCSQCNVDCSYCQVRKVDMTNVNSLNLQYNSIQRINIEGVRAVDLRYNLLTEVSLSVDHFDVRHNAFSDPTKVDIQGQGFLADNPWVCKCAGLRELREKSKDKQLLCGGQTFESCFTGPKKSSHSAWVTLVVAVVILAAFILILYCIKLTSRKPDPPQPQDAGECEQVYRNDALPTYEEALRMSKPEWRQSRTNSRRYRPD